MSGCLRISIFLIASCMNLISALNSISGDPNCEKVSRDYWSCDFGIPDVYFYNQTLLDDVKFLEILNCDYIQVKNDTFSNLKNLNSLTISCNNTEISSDSFDDLSNVDYLYISKNVISFPKNIFCNFNSLQHLWLDENQLSTDDDVGLATNCSAFNENISCGQNITWLSLMKNNLTTIKNDGFLCNLRALTRLDLNNNSISEIDEGAFNSIPKLSSLKLARNSLSNLSGHIFDSLIKLSNLDLSHNQLSSVPDTLFNALPNLRYLNLIDNSLTRLNSDTFKNSLNLIRLDISHNDLFNISRSFVNLTQLKELKLSWNRLENIDASTFYNLSKLNKLRLDRNLIGEISEDAFTGCPRMYLLDLSHNQLSEVPQFKPDNEIVILVLHHNKIKNISNSVVNFTAANETTQFSSEPKQMADLELSYNNIEFVNEEIIQALSRRIFFTSINMLDLSHNQITSFDYPNNVVQLNLAHNQIGQLPAFQLENTSLMKHLNLSHNLIDRISRGQFPPALIYLFLDSNKINYVESFSFENLTNLKILSVRDNLLTTWNNFNLSRTLTSIDLRDNPWSCECHLIQPLFHFIQTHRRQIKTGNELLCQANNGTEPPIQIINFNITQCSSTNY